MSMAHTNIIATSISRISLAYNQRRVLLNLPYSALLVPLLAQLQILGVVSSFRVVARNCRNPRQRPVRSSYTHELFVVLKYVQLVPLYSSFRCYWALRRKISVGYDGVGRGLLNSRQIFIL
jgi:ribosomal protein S8